MTGSAPPSVVMAEGCLQNGRTTWRQPSSRSLLDRSGIDSSLVEDVILGNTNQAGEDCRNVARNAALLAGMHTSVGGVTVNRLCGSGAAATLDAARAITCSQGQLFIAGGVESMSRGPWVLNKGGNRL